RPCILLCQPANVHALSLVVLSFFDGYRDHLVLHSFPTRRSSDLGRGAAFHGEERLGDGHGDLVVGVRHYLAVALDDAQLAWCGGDRKSTRLNSSHVKISYAVFCLKKKNNDIRNISILSGNDLGQL